MKTVFTRLGPTLWPLAGGKVRIPTHRRSLQYLGLLLVLLILSIVLPYTGLRGDVVFSAVAGTLSANLAMLVGLVALVYYFGTKSPLYVFAGSGFLGAALLDSVQVITVWLHGGAPWGAAAAESGSRWFLPLWLWFGVWVSSREQRLASLIRGATAAICLAGAGLTLLCLLWVRASPWAAVSGGILGHAAAAVLSFGAVEALLRRRNWPHDAFEHCLMLSLVVGFLLNTLFLSGSSEIHDALFTAAQHLKNLSYLLALAGLVIAMRQSLQRAEQDARTLAEVNETLRWEVGEHQRVRQQFQELAVSLEQRVEERTKESAEAQQAAEHAKEEAERARRVEQEANGQLRAQIEERLAAEQALRESESRLQLALSAGQIGLWTWDIAGDSATWDEHVYHIFGQTPRDLTPSYKNSVSLIHPDDVEGVRQAIERAVEQNTDFDIACRVVRPDGGIRHVVSRAMAVRDDAEKTTRMIGTVVDVTEHKRGEEELRRRGKELGQMVKVLSCLYEIAHLLEQVETPLEQIYERIIDLLPLSWHDPENTVARLEAGGREYRSGGWHDTGFKQCAEIVVDGEAIGRLEIGFSSLEGEQERFRQEEIKVTRMVAASLGRTIEYKRAAENLRRSERRYRGLFDQMISGCALHEIIVDETGKPTDYRFLEINPAFERMVGLRAEAALGKTVREVLPGIEQQWIETYGQVALGGEPVRVERYIRQLGRYFEVAAFSPEKGRFAIIFNDITERRQAESQRAGEHNLLRTLIDNVPDSIYVKDTARRYLINNKENLKILGLAEGSQARGKTVFDFFPEEHARLYDSDDRAVLESRVAVFDREEPYRDAQGHLRCYSTTKVPLFDTNGGVIGLVGISRDITERKRAEEALRLSQFSLDHAADSIFWVGPDSRLLYVNDAACASLGYTRERLLSMTVGDFDEDAKEHWKEHWDNVKQAGAVTAESSHVTATGERIPIEVNANYLNFDGKEYYCAFVRDITARKRVAEALERQAKELIASNAELEHFAHAASHDLQEPLRMIAGYTQLLARRYRGKLDSEADEFIRFIVEGAERMQALIRDLLAYSRAGRTSLALDLVDVEDCAHASLANLGAVLEENAAAVELGPLPEIRGQRSQLIQLFQNLIGNAVKYHADEPPRVRVSSELRGNEWLFTVRDNGIGIDPQYREQVFELFRRLHSRSEYSGTGIGLAICKKIVENHGGRIWVDSEPGRGASFHFTLPAEGSTATAARQGADEASRGEHLAAPPDAR